MSNLEKQNESALACLARDGDREALAQLLKDNWAWLKGIAYNIIASPEAVEDILQNVCVLCLEKVSTLREPERFKPWLAMVARNAALGYRQKRSKQPGQLDELAAAYRLDPKMGSIVDRLDEKEQAQRVLDALKKLPEKYREVFILKHIKEMSYADIGEIIESPITTVQIRLVRSRRMLYNDLTGKPNNKVPRT